MTRHYLFSTLFPSILLWNNKSFLQNSPSFPLYIFNNICYIVNRTSLFNIQILQPGNCGCYLELNIEINLSQKVLLMPPVLRWCLLPPYVPLRGAESPVDFRQHRPKQHVDQATRVCLYMNVPVQGSSIMHLIARRQSFVNLRID